MDAITTYKVFDEADLLLKHFEKRTAKGSSLDDGLLFCHFLSRSGLLELLKANAAGSVSKINVPKLTKRVEKLMEAIRAQPLKGNRP